MNRGDIFLVDFKSARPAEANKVRPAVLITNEQANRFGPRVMVVPLTGNVDKVYPFQLFLPAEQTGLERDSKAQVELTRSVSRTRLGKHIGHLSERLLKLLGLTLHLALK